MSALEQVLNELQQTNKFNKFKEHQQAYKLKQDECQTHLTKIKELSDEILKLESSKILVDADTTLEQIDAISRANNAIDIKISLINQLITKNNDVVHSLSAELEGLAKSNNTMINGLWMEMISICEKRIKQMDTELFSILNTCRIKSGLPNANLDLIINVPDLFNPIRKEINKYIPDFIY